MGDVNTQAPSEAELLAELTEAKAAYRDDRTEDNRERKATAVDAIRSHRIATRSDRGAPTIGGDAYLTGQEG